MTTQKKILSSLLSALFVTQLASAIDVPPVVEAVLTPVAIQLLYIETTTNADEYHKLEVAQQVSKKNELKNKQKKQKQQTQQPKKFQNKQNKRWNQNSK